MKVIVINEKESVIYNGEIYKFGHSFDVDEVIGKSLIERGYVTSEEVGEAEMHTGYLDADEVREMSYPELKKLAASLGLPTNGKKDELVERILEAGATAPEDEDEEEEEADETPDSSDLPDTGMPE